MTAKYMTKTITAIFAMAALLAGAAAQADIQCGLDHPSRVAFDLKVIENVDNTEFNTIVIKEQWGQKQHWLGKMTVSIYDPNKLGDFKTKKTVDLAENGILTIVYSKSNPIGNKPCGRGSCDTLGSLPLESIKAQLVNGEQIIGLNCHETAVADL